MLAASSHILHRGLDADVSYSSSGKNCFHTSPLHVKREAVLLSGATDLYHALQVFQRQMSKEGLQAVVNGNDAAGGGWSSEMLRDLFTLRQDTASDTYDSRCRPDADDGVADDEEGLKDGNGAKHAVASPEHKLQVKRLPYVQMASCAHMQQHMDACYLARI